MKIQIASDLHLEDNNTVLKTIITPAAPILCLCGDITSQEEIITFDKFLKFYGPQFDHILHVPGNHEYYGARTMQNVDETFSNFSKICPNYKYLNNDYFLLNEYVFVGSTLWTKIPDEYHDFIKDYMNDYAHIFIEDAKQLSVNDTQIFHQKSVDFINDSINRFKENKIIILTHHKPIWDICHNFYIQQHAFETNLYDMMGDPIKLWAFGHTHRKYDRNIYGTRVISNPYGYAGETTNYKSNLTITI